MFQPTANKDSVLQVIYEQLKKQDDEIIRNYHFNNALNIPANYDFYAGLNVGFNIWTSPTTYDGSHSSGLAIGTQLGGRYYFNNKLGLNLEFSGGNSASNSKLGLSFRL